MWIIVGCCRVGGWVVLAAALCYVKSKVRGRVQKQKEREKYERGCGVWEEGEIGKQGGWSEGGGRQERGASYQNISMQSSYWCSKDCCLSTAAADFQVCTAMSLTHTCMHTWSETQHKQQKLYSLHLSNERNYPFFCHFVPKSFIYLVIDPCHTFSFSRGAY